MLKRFKQKTKKNNEENRHRRFFFMDNYPYPCIPRGESRRRTGGDVKSRFGVVSPESVPKLQFRSKSFDVEPALACWRDDSREYRAAQLRVVIFEGFRRQGAAVRRRQRLHALRRNGSHALDREVRGQAPARSLDLRRSADRDHAELLLYSENRVLCHLGDSEFEHGFGWNSDFLLRLGIKTRARLPLLFDQLAKAGQNEFARLFDRFVSEGPERIEEYSSGLLIGLGGFQQERGEVLFWSSLESFMTAASDAFKEIVPPLLHPTPPVVTHWFQ